MAEEVVNKKPAIVQLPARLFIPSRTRQIDLKLRRCTDQMYVSQ